jgi:hypothetical protein
MGTAVGPDGENVVLVGSSQPDVPDEIKGVLGLGEIAVKWLGHAEESIINWAERHGFTIDRIAASRPACDGICKPMMDQRGIREVGSEEP